MDGERFVDALCGLALQQGRAKAIRVTLVIHCTSSLMHDIPVKVVVGKGAETTVTGPQLRVMTKLTLKLDLDDVQWDPEPFTRCSCGSIHTGTYRGQEVSVLAISQSTDPEQLRRDVELCDSLRSNYILTLTGAVYVPQRLMIVAEAIQLGTLYDVRPRADFTLAASLKCVLNVALALWAVHGSSHAYLRLRPQNIVVCAR